MQRCDLVRTLCLFGILGIFGACSTPGPSPAEWEALDLPNVTLDAEDRNTVASLTEDAGRALAAGRITEAARIAERALWVDPRAALARAILGIALLEPAMQEDPPALAWMERAEGELRLARRLDPDNPQIAMFYARFLEVDGQMSLAAKVLDDLLVKLPDHLSALRVGSRLHFELGHERQAGELLERLVERSPEDSDAWYRLALCQLRLAEAIERGDTELRVDVPQVVRDSYLRSAESYRAYIGLRGDDVEGFIGEATARFRALVAHQVEATRKAEIAEVLAILSKAARVDSKSAAPLHNQALVHQHLGDQAKARAAYEAALLRDKNFLPSILNLAHILDADGEHAAARALCQRALALKPTDSEARRLRAYLSSKQP
ncbi:MAG: tetratricopeptide repeat protein [Planctomycetota bacterium]|nr:tetratricopeptide repeat protein [Planctomycetota bacterium]